MLVSRPVAALGAVVLAAAALGSGPAAAAPADTTPTVPDRTASAVRLQDAVGRDDARALTSALAARSTTTFAVRSTRASATPGVRAAAGKLGAELAPASSPLAALGWTSVTVPTAEAASTLAQLEALPGVAEVVAAQPRFPDYVPNDTLYAAKQSPMMTALQSPSAWDIAQGSGITIAVLDGGFAVTHPDLASKIDTTWDVVSGNATVTDSPSDTVPGHGTAAASVAAAATNNSQGIAGAAPLARLMLVQVGDDANAGEITDLTSAAGIRWAVDHGADVISMSYGATGTPSTPESDAVAYAVANDVVVVASAGNDGLKSVHYPAGLPSVIAVGATTNTGTAQADWSTYGTWVDVAAPGESVPVALPSIADDDGVVDGYSLWNGTSFAGPLVAGIAAVLRSANPSATEAEVRAALTSTTKPITLANSGYAHGLVQAATAARILVNPSITSPAAAAEVSGTVTVSATSGASNVRFSVDGTTVATKIATSAGTATGTLSTYGLSGAVALRAQSCNAAACGTGSTIGVTVSNDPPVLTSPADGAAIETSMTLTATSDGDAVKFLGDGSLSLGIDKVAPFSLIIDTAALSDGAHTITAVQCSADGLTCDTAHPSNARSITVSRLRPTVRVSPNPFSPNADGRRDTATVTYTNDVAQIPTIRVQATNGTIVRRTTLVSSTATSAGTHSWVWNGRNTAGNVVPDGTYTIMLTSTQVGGVKKGAATTTVKIDKVKPVSSSVTPSSPSVYPVVDAFRDSVTLGAKTNEAVGSYAVYITNSTGTRIRTITGGAKPAGRVDVTWKGTTNSGKRAADGIYAFQVLLQDVAGNQTLSAKGRVTISWKSLKARTATKTIPAMTTTLGYVADNICNFVFANARPGVWPSTSIAYESRDPENCATNGMGDVAFTLSQYTLPSALKYGTVSVSTYGGGSTSGQLRSHVGDQGEIDYVLKDGDTIGVYRTLSSGTTTHAGPTVKAADYLVNGRTIKWWMGSANGNWYDVRDFTITWTYYVLA